MPVLGDISRTPEFVQSTNAEANDGHRHIPTPNGHARLVREQLQTRRDGLRRILPYALPACAWNGLRASCKVNHCCHNNLIEHAYPSSLYGTEIACTQGHCGI